MLLTLYQRYAALLQQQKVLARERSKQASREWRGWKARFVWTSAAAVAVLAIAAILIFTRPGPKPISYSAFTLDLQNLSQSRGASPESGIRERQVGAAPK